MKRGTLRLAKPSDWDAIVALHAEQNERDGTEYPLPTLFGDKGIVLALVVELDSKVIQALWFEARTVELCFAGCDQRGTAIAEKDIEYFAYLLRQRGIAGINCKVPKQVSRAIGKPLRRGGFKRDDKTLDHFYRSTEAQNGTLGE